MRRVMRDIAEMAGAEVASLTTIVALAGYFAIARALESSVSIWMDGGF